MPRLTFIVLLVLACLGGCTDSPEQAAYRKVKALGGSDDALLLSHYNKLPDSEKIVVYFGANEIHPPDTRVSKLISVQSLDFLHLLRAKVLEKNSYVVTFDYVINVESAKRSKRMTNQEYESLDLSGLCKALPKETSTCLQLISDP